MEVASPFNASLVSVCGQKLFRLYFSGTRGRLSEMPKVLLPNDFVIENTPTIGFVLPFTLKF